MRAFLAIEPSPALKRAIASSVLAQLSGTNGYRAVAEAQLHVTLRFWSELDDARVDEVVHVLTPVCASQKPFDVDVAGALSTFHPRRANVLWLALNDVDGRLAALARSVEDALDAIGFEPAEPGFRAHLTVARAEGRGRVHPPNPRVDAPSSGALRVDGLTLFKSVTSSSGAVHTPIARIPFA